MKALLAGFVLAVWLVAVGCTAKAPQSFIPLTSQGSDSSKVDSGKTRTRHEIGQARFFGKASLRMDRGIWIMDLHGTRAEMARQHGALIKDMVQQSALPYFAHKVKSSIDNSYVVRNHPWLEPILRGWINFKVFGPMRRNVPDDMLEVIKAFSEGAGVDPDWMRDALVTPDVGQILTAQYFGSERKIDQKTYYMPPTGFGCTTLVAAASRTREGLIHARNLDYEGFNLWEKNPVVIYFHPDRPDELRYVSISTLGIHTAGITSSNEAGITMTLHQLQLDDASTDGAPIIGITDEMIRKARTIDQAAEILTRAKFASGWAVNVSSAYENRAFVAEVSAGGASIKWMDGDYQPFTNHVHTEAKRVKEFAISHEGFADSVHRYQSLKSQVARRKSLSKQDAVDLLSSQEFFADASSSGVRRPADGIIALMHNIQSVVFVPAEKVVYVAVPAISGGKANEGRYVAVPLNVAELEDEAALSNALEKAPEDLMRSESISKDQLKAHAFYRAGMQKAEDDVSFEEAGRMILEARNLDPGQSYYPMVAGLSYFRHAGEVEGDDQRMALKRANTLLDEALSKHPSAYHTSLIHLFKGRYHDILGERDAAVAEYQMVDQSQSKPLTAAAKAGLESPYDAGDLNKISINFNEGDVFQF